MPKIKTNRGAAKRFRKTASGQLRRKQSHARHLLTKKNSKRKRMLHMPGTVHDNDRRAIRKMLPYA